MKSRSLRRLKKGPKILDRPAAYRDGQLSAPDARLKRTGGASTTRQPSASISICAPHLVAKIDIKLAAEARDPDMRLALDRVMVRLGLDDIERRLYGLGASRAAGLLIEGAREPAREPLGPYRPGFAVPIDVEVRVGGHIGGVEKLDSPARALKMISACVCALAPGPAPISSDRASSRAADPATGALQLRAQCSRRRACLLFFSSESAARTSGTNGAPWFFLCPLDEAGQRINVVDDVNDTSRRQRRPRRRLRIGSASAALLALALTGFLALALLSSASRAALSPWLAPSLPSLLPPAPNVVCVVAEHRRDRHGDFAALGLPAPGGLARGADALPGLIVVGPDAHPVGFSGKRNGGFRARSRPRRRPRRRTDACRTSRTRRLRRRGLAFRIGLAEPDAAATRRRAARKQTWPIDWRFALPVGATKVW